MAADVPSGGRLPPDFNYGVTRDGRVFFIDERRKDTTWLHPLTGRPVQTGFYNDPGLPDGWEQAVTLEGILYYIDHNTRTTSFQHPVTGRGHQTGNTSSKSLPQNTSQQSTKTPKSPQTPTSPVEKNFKRNQAKQRSVKAPSAKRNPTSRVIRRAWLYRWETSGLTKSWKKRWCVLVDFALFVYKDEHEENAVASVLLPSYRINMVLPADPVFRQYAFKLEHENTKTLYFATDSTSDLENWVSLLRQEAMMKGQKGLSGEFNNNKPQKLIPKSPIISRNNDASDDEPLFPGNLHSQDPGGYRRLQRDEDIEPPDSRLTAPYPGNNTSVHQDRNKGDSHLPSRDRDSYSTGYSRTSRDLTPGYSQGGHREYNPSEDHADSRYNSLNPERQTGVEHPRQAQNPGDSSDHPSNQANRNKVSQNVEDQDRYRDSLPGYDGPQHNNGHRQDNYNSMPRDGTDRNQFSQEPSGFPGRQKRMNPSYFDGDEHSGREPHDIYPRDGETRNQQLEGYVPPPSWDESQNIHGPGFQGGIHGNDGHNRERSSRASDHPAFDDYQRHNPSGYQYEGYHGDRSSRASDHPHDGYHGDRSSRASDHPPYNGHHGDRSSKSLEHSPYDSYQPSNQQEVPGYSHDNSDNREHSMRSSSSLTPLTSQGLRRHPELTVTIPHTYVNLPSDTDSGDRDSSSRRQDMSPGRPPYPVSVRQQIAQEIAQTKTPHTSHDYLTAVENEKKRMQQREYFQYPTPQLPPDQAYNQSSPEEHIPRRDQTDGSFNKSPPANTAKTNHDQNPQHENYGRGPHHEQSFSDPTRLSWQDRSRDSLNRDSNYGLFPDNSNRNVQDTDREMHNARGSWSRDARVGQPQDSISRNSYPGRSQDNLGRDPQHDHSRDSLSRDQRHDHSRDSLSRDQRHDHSRDSLSRDQRHDHSRDSLSRDQRHDHSRDSLSRDQRHDHSRDSFGRDPRHDYSRDSFSRDLRHDHSRDSLGRDPSFNRDLRHDNSRDSLGRDPSFNRDLRHDNSRDSLGRDPSFNRDLRHDNSRDSLGRDPSFNRDLRHDNSQDSLGRDPKHDYSHNSLGRDSRTDQTDHSFNNQSRPTHYKSLGSMDRVGVDEHSSSFARPLRDGNTNSRSLGNLGQSPQGRSPQDDRSPPGSFPDNVSGQRHSLDRSPMAVNQPVKLRPFVSGPKQEAQEMRDAYKSIQELQQRQKEEDYSMKHTRNVARLCYTKATRSTERLADETTMEMFYSPAGSYVPNLDKPDSVVERGSAFRPPSSYSNSIRGEGSLVGHSAAEACPHGRHTGDQLELGSKADVTLLGHDSRQDVASDTSRSHDFPSYDSKHRDFASDDNIHHDFVSDNNRHNDFALDNNSHQDFVSDNRHDFASNNNRHHDFASDSNRHDFASDNNRHHDFASDNNRHDFASDNNRHHDFASDNNSHHDFAPDNNSHHDFAPDNNRHHDFAPDNNIHHDSFLDNNRHHNSAVDNNNHYVGASDSSMDDFLLDSSRHPVFVSDNIKQQGLPLEYDRTHLDVSSQYDNRHHELPESDIKHSNLQCHSDSQHCDFQSDGHIKEHVIGDNNKLHDFLSDKQVGDLDCLMEREGRHIVSDYDVAVEGHVSAAQHVTEHEMDNPDHPFFESEDGVVSSNEVQTHGRLESGQNWKKRPELSIHTVKEEPDMLDTDVLETRKLQSKNKKYPLNGNRLRMSISAGDLIGKTHDELVLLLIQLRRNQASLDKARDYYRECLEKRRSVEREYRRQRSDSSGHLEESLEENHQSFLDLKRELEEIENKQEVYKPLINLVDNMVTMGSLYGGDNLMLATQYRKHLLRPDQFTEPKVMLEFSREHQEKRFLKEIEDEIKQLSTDEVDLEEKLEKLYELDRKLQEQSFRVTSLQEDKEFLEKALTGILHQQDQFRNNPREMRSLVHRQRTIEKELSVVMQQLAEASQALEETTAENNRIEHEVTLLRTKVNGELSRSRSAPSLVGESARAKVKMEKELAKVQTMMAGLSNEGARLKEAITTLRRSSSGTQLAALLENESETTTTKKKPSSYLITDIDTNETVDASKSSAGDSFGLPYDCVDKHSDSFGLPYDSVDKHSDSFGLPYNGVDNQSSPPVTEESVSTAQRTYLTSGPESHTTHSTFPSSDRYGPNPDHSADSDQMDSRLVKGDDAMETKRPIISHQRQESFATASEDENDSDGSMIVDPEAPDVTWDIRDAEDNTKRFFGIIPKEKSKLTVRDVKRQHDQRKEREKMRREEDDEQSGCYSVPGNKQIPMEHLEHQDDDGHNWYPPSVNMNTDTGPLYENLPRARSVPALAPDSSAPGSRRSSIILMTPKPFIRYEDRQTGLVTAKPFVARPFNSELQLHTESERRFQPVSFDPNAGRDPEPFRFDPNAGRDPEPFGTQPYYSDMNLNTDTTDNGQATAQGDYSSTELSPHAVPSTEKQSLQSPVEVQYPWLKSFGQQESGIYNVKRSPKGRYLTISSTQPVKLETKSWPKASLHSVAGDLMTNRPIDNVPDIVKSSTKKIEMELYDEFTIDRELYRPGPVEIPERYMPDLDEEYVSEEEKLKRCEKAEKIKKILAQQSVHSLSQPDISQVGRQGIHQKVEMEKFKRSQLLGLGQELARQVTLKSKEAAAKRRKTWSGDQFAEAMKIHQNNESLQRDLSPDRQDMYV